MLTLKTKIEKRMEFIAKRVPLDPNIVSLLAVFSMAAAGYFILNYKLILAGFFALLSGFFDLLDGGVAKAHKKVTKFGGLLDRICDRISDFIILSSIILAGFVPLWIGLLSLVLVLLSSYISACLEAQTKTKIGEALSLRGIRLSIIIAALFINQIFLAIVIIIILSLFAFVQRLVKAYEILRA
jgi:archaetidylinositol phosphate synthase